MEDNTTNTHSKLDDKDWLTRRYVVDLATQEEIARELGVNKPQVKKALLGAGIQPRRSTSKYPLLNDKGWLIDAYEIKLMSTEAIAKVVGCHSGLVYDMLKRLGVKMRSMSEAQINSKRSGHNHPNWKGGRSVNCQGYVTVPAKDHPNAMPNGRILEHRLVAEKKLGRLLESNEVVHHIDGNKENNDPSNLVVFTREKHNLTHRELLDKVTQLKRKLEVYERLYGVLPKDT